MLPSLRARRRTASPTRTCSSHRRPCCRSSTTPSGWAPLPFSLDLGILAINYVLTGEYERSAPYAVRHAEKDESYDSAFAAGFRKDATPGSTVKPAT
ncbi:hypothetical protein DIPPA_22872 [Diplonema papillatum]|nr:hypothetical protein DIPPA_22872 [Diplonema papillatum]